MEDQEEYSPEWFTRIMELQGAAEGFRLQSLTRPNTTAYPNFYMDWLMAYLTGEEWKVLSYIVRRTFGFHDEDIQKGIAVSCIANGFVSTKNGSQLELGTGLSTATICKAIDFLESLGIVIVTKRMGAPALYQINFGDDPRFPLHISLLATREAKLQKRLGPTMVAAAVHAREELAIKRAKDKTIDLTLDNNDLDTQYFSTQNTDDSLLPRKTQSFTAQNNSILPTKSIKESLERKYIPTHTEQATSAPQQSQPIASNGIIPPAGNGASVRAAAIKAGRVQKAVKAAGAAAIVAALPAEQADKARKMLRGYLAGKAIAQDKTPSREIPDDEFVAAHAVHVVSINGGYKPSDVLNCVVWLVRVQQWGLMYITPKSTVANLSEWRAAGSPKYSGGTEI